MAAEPQRLVLYVDDGYPESRDYDDNYVAVDAPEPRGQLQAPRRLWPGPALFRSLAAWFALAASSSSPPRRPSSVC